MTCRLCNESKPLRNSHIIPEFMYQGMYDAKHRFFGLSSNHRAREQIAQKGLREPLLCSSCEQQFGRYERYASSVFYGGMQYGRKREGNLIHLSGLEYRRLKLFLLSMLWRMGVTSLPALRGTELGRNSELLREMLHHEDPGDARDYPCVITAVMIDGAHLRDLILYGGEATLDGQRVWSFVAAGFVFSFFEAGALVPPSVRPVFLNPEGTLVVAVKDVTKIAFLHEQLLGIAEARRNRDPSDRR